MFWSTTSRQAKLVKSHASGSLLARVFNELWAMMLGNRKNLGVTHFAMLHSDIVPAGMDWIDALLGELVRTRADVVSAVVPIKTTEGLTSTAIDSVNDPWNVQKRLTMSEVMTLPETFSAADAGFPDRNLLVNTGCWICDVSKPWVDKVHFQIHDRIINGPGGWSCESMSEDWDFSRQVQRLGGKVLATRAVKLAHIGIANYPNDQVWGSAAVDPVSPPEPAVA
jgi:hypothetical protein